MKHILILSSLVFGACVGTGDLNGPVTPPKPDAFEKIYEDAPPPPIDMGPAAGCVERDPAPKPPFIHTGAGGAAGTMAGEKCTAAGCHNIQNNGTANAPGFLVGGTVFKAGTSDPDPGVAILIVPDSAPTTPLKLVTDQAGNFYVKRALGGGGAYVPEGGTTNLLPASAMATVCPTLIHGHQSGKLMMTPTGGNCNDCHKNAAVNPNGTQGQILY